MWHYDTDGTLKNIVEQFSENSSLCSEIYGCPFPVWMWSTRRKHLIFPALLLYNKVVAVECQRCDFQYAPWKAMYNLKCFLIKFHLSFAICHRLESLRENERTVAKDSTPPRVIIYYPVWEPTWMSLHLEKQNLL